MTQCVPLQPNGTPPWTRDEVFENHPYENPMIRVYNLAEASTARWPQDVKVRYELTEVHPAYTGMDHWLRGIDSPEARDAKRKAKAWARFQEPVPLKPR